MRLALCEAPTLEQPQHRELRARSLFFDNCVGSLTSHRIFRVEGIVRRDLRLRVLIREDLKV